MITGGEKLVCPQITGQIHADKKARNSLNREILEGAESAPRQNRNQIPAELLR
jgi:DNA-binding FrmR family transcriptional regulator